MKKNVIGKAIALLTCFTTAVSVTACGKKKKEESSLPSVLTVEQLGAGFDAKYLPDMASVDQSITGKIDVALDFEGTQGGWKKLAEEYQRLHGNAVVVNINTEFSGSRYSERLNQELQNHTATDWDIVEGNLGYGNTSVSCINMTAGIDAPNPYCGKDVKWVDTLQAAAYQTKEADAGKDSYIMNSEVMQTCWFINDVAFDAAVAKGYKNSRGQEAYPITWDDLINLCAKMQEAGYTNPLGITLCDASIDSLQFTWLLRVYGDYYYRQFYKYIMADDVWANYKGDTKVVETNSGYGVKYTKILQMMFNESADFCEAGYVGLNSEVYKDMVGNLAKMKGYLMQDVASTEFAQLRDEFETQADGMSAPQIMLDYQGFGITYGKSNKLELGYFDYPQMISGKYTEGMKAGQDIVDNENTITRDIGGNGGFLSVVNHIDANQNKANKDFIKFVMSPYGQTVYYQGLAESGAVPKGLTSVKNELVVLPSEWKAFFDESGKTITFNGDVDANPFLNWGVRYALGYRESQNVIRDYWKGLLMTNLSAEQTLTVDGFTAKWAQAVRLDVTNIMKDNGWDEKAITDFKVQIN